MLIKKRMIKEKVMKALKHSGILHRKNISLIKAISLLRKFYEEKRCTGNVSMMNEYEKILKVHKKNKSSKIFDTNMNGELYDEAKKKLLEDHYKKQQKLKVIHDPKNYKENGIRYLIITTLTDLIDKIIEFPNIIIQNHNSVHNFVHNMRLYNKFRKDNKMNNLKNKKENVSPWEMDGYLVILKPILKIEIQSNKITNPDELRPKLRYYKSLDKKSIKTNEIQKQINKLESNFETEKKKLKEKLKNLNRSLK